MSRDTTTVVEFTEAHLKLVQSKDTPQGKILTQIIFKELASESEEGVAKALVDLLAEKKIRADEIIGVLPRSQATVRLLRLPSQEPSEIDNMVNLQIAKHTPYTRDDVVVDYLVGGKDAEGYSAIMLVIVHKDIVSRYLNIFKAARLSLSQLALSSQGVCNLYLFYQNKLNFPQGKEVLVILDIDKIDTEVCFYHQGNLVFSRALQFGTQDIAEDKISSLLEELRLTLLSFNKEKVFAAPRKLILASTSQNLSLLSQRIETELSLAVDIIKPQAELFRERAENLSLNWLEGDISANAAIGLALEKSGKVINLLPNTLIVEQKELGKKKEAVSLTVIALVVLGLALLSVSARVYKKSRYLFNLAQEIVKVEPKADETERMAKKLALIKERLQPSVSAVDVIYDLYDKFPTGMSLGVLDLDENGNISLQGVSLVMADVFSFQSVLEKSTRFKNVEVKFASKRNTRLGEVTDFKITCQLEK